VTGSPGALCGQHSRGEPGASSLRRGPAYGRLQCDPVHLEDRSAAAVDVQVSSFAASSWRALTSTEGL
jgi:hypothetical protein